MDGGKTSFKLKRHSHASGKESLLEMIPYLTTMRKIMNPNQDVMRNHSKDLREDLFINPQPIVKERDYPEHGNRHHRSWGSVKE